MPKRRKLRGGWEESDEDFVNYRRNVMDPEFPNLGGVQRTMTIELITWANSKFNLGLPDNDDFQSVEIETIIRFLRNTVMKENPTLLTDDLNYDITKFSVIPQGTRFYRRMKTDKYNPNRPDPAWFDYTATMSESKFSFLKDTNERFTQQYLDRTINHFGNYLYEFEVTNDILIIDFPSRLVSYFETYIRRMCDESRSSVCVDGYTMDFLKYNTKPVYKPLPSIDGLRELCILDPKNFRMIRMIPDNMPTLSLSLPQPMKRVPSPRTRRTPPSIIPATQPQIMRTPPPSRRSSSSSRKSRSSSRKSTSSNKSTSSRRSSSSNKSTSKKRDRSFKNLQPTQSRRKHCETLFDIR